MVPKRNSDLNTADGESNGTGDRSADNAPSGTDDRDRQRADRDRTRGIDQ